MCWKQQLAEQKERLQGKLQLILKNSSQPLTLDDDSNINRKRGSRSNKKESARSSLDEKKTQGPTKHSKTEKSVLSNIVSRRIAGGSHSQNHVYIREDAIQPGKIEP